MGSPVSLEDFGKWSLQMASSTLFLAALVRYSATSGIFDTFRLQDPVRGRRDDPAFNELLVNTYRQRLQAFIHISRVFGIQPVIMTEPFSGSANTLTPDWVNLTPLDQFNTVIREVGEVEGVHVIDLVHHLQERVPEWNRPMNIFYDGIHVTDKGSQIYAQHITERLRPLILEHVNFSPSERHKSHGSR